LKLLPLGYGEERVQAKGKQGTLVWGVVINKPLKIKTRGKKGGPQDSRKKDQEDRKTLRVSSEECKME